MTLPSPTLSELTRVFARIGCVSFGGPAAQIGLMHRELVADRPWLSEAEYLRALSLCMLLPGPEAMQLATYAGWKLHGVKGGLIGGALFVLPGAVVIFALAYLYAAFGGIPFVQAAFLGVKAAVVVIVFQALIRIWPKAMSHPVAVTLAIMAFFALFAFGLPFPLVITVAALVGAVFLPKKEDASAAGSTEASTSKLLRTCFIWGALWTAPLLALWVFQADFLLTLGLFFSKLAVVTFGGAYAVLAYMTQTVVGDLGWLDTQQMIDALGLAETTPGPLILVTQFVAVLAGLGAGNAALGAVAGLLALWVTFIPCFLWIFAAAPYVETLDQRPRLNAALQGITAAVVGVIANLSIWFALHVLFGDVSSLGALPLPVWESFNMIAAALIAAAAGLLVWLRLPIWLTLIVCALLGVMPALIT